MSTAVMFHRMGPYHHARLRAAAEATPLVAVEMAGSDRTYAWSTVAPCGSFPCHTVFKDRMIESMPAGILAAGVHGVLNRIQPTSVAIAGWSARWALAALDWCIKSRRPAILMSETGRRDAPRRPLAECAKRRLVSMYSAAFAGGSPHRDYLLELGMPENRIQIGYDVVDNAHFAEGADSARRRRDPERLRLELPDRFFLCCARFVDKKNLPMLLGSFAEHLASAGGAAWDLVLVGDGPLMPAIKARCSAPDLCGKVVLCGFRQYEDLPAYYGLAGAFILPSMVEQWGLVVNEAMAAGLPVLVSERAGCAPDLVRNGVNGWLFPPDNRRALADLMTRVSAENCDLAGMGADSRRIIAGWTPRRFADGLAASVETAARVGPPAAGGPARAALWAAIHLRRNES